MKKIDLVSGMASLCLSLIYIGAFIYFGLFSNYPYEASTSEQIAYLSTHHFSVASIYFLIYVVFGVVLSVLVLGLHEKCFSSSGLLRKLSTLFGVIWVGFVIASGMISVIGLNAVVDLSGTDVDRAFETWMIVMLLTESLGGGNELLGGLWVLLASICNLSAKIFNKPLNYLGIFVGAAGIATVYPAEIFTEIFGFSQIIWFIFLGICFISNHNADNQHQIRDCDVRLS